MRTIHILLPETFVKYKSTIGIVFSIEDDNFVNFCTGHDESIVNADSLTTVTLEEIQKELIKNDELKELSFDNKLIEIHNQDIGNYLDYVSSYN
jgi:hypothetical protein